MTTEQQEKERAERERAEEKRKREIALDVQRDFAARRQARREIELGWQLDMSFYSGDQYCEVTPRGTLEEEGSEYYWQSRRCFNHVAPTVDTRLARLSKVRPTLCVRPFSDAEDDVKTARLCSNILKSVATRLDLDRVISRATLWSEICGTAFYKVVWNFNDGKVIGADLSGKALREGDVNVIPLSPFELYPDSLAAESMQEVRSMIHAKAVPVCEIAERFGVEIAGRSVSEFPLLPYSSASGWKRPAEAETAPVLENAEILIERYVRPDAEHPEGRLEIVAGERLLYEGPLPYKNGDCGERALPFIRQSCLELAGAFFGSSIVDRMIPLQRAYNAVRNRKHEFLNRLSAGVIAVEDGSVDAEELAEEGLYPGKVIVYRRGSAEPHFLDCGNVPSEFEKEEERLQTEFVLFSGVSEISRNSSNPTHVTSASGLQLLLDQDTARMQMSAESVERAMKEMGKQILHLYKQFAASRRLLRMTGTGGNTELFYFDASEISADDVQFDTSYEKTPEERKEELLKLLSLGLLKDENGKLPDDVKNRVLDALGYGSFENARDISALHAAKAARENLLLRERESEADDYDDHALHIAEHTRALLSGEETDEQIKQNFVRHIESHRRKTAYGS